MAAQGESLVCIMLMGEAGNVPRVSVCLCVCALTKLMIRNHLCYYVLMIIARYFRN